MSSPDGRFLELPSRDQETVFGPTLRQQVAGEEDVLALEAAVDQLDLTALEAEYRRVGPPAYPPALLLKVLIYGYSLGLRASRQLERACRLDLGFRFLTHTLQPDHVTLCRFRREHVEQLEALFAQTVRLCQQAGLVRLGEVAIDGTKLRADRSRRQLAEAREALARALREAEQADADIPLEAEPAAAEPQTSSEPSLLEPELTAEPGAESQPEEPARGGREADQDCTFLQTSEGVRPGYNCQLAVDGESQVIVAEAVSVAADDKGHLPEMVAQVQQNCGAAPAVVLADGGYYAQAAIAQVDSEATRVYVPGPEPGGGRMEWDEREQAYRCPAGHWLRFCGERKGHLVYRTNSCQSCTQARRCGIQGKSKELHVPAPGTALGKLRARMQTAAGRAQYARRAVIVEPAFAWLKHHRGFRRLLLRGQRGARAEWALHCMGHNLRQWARAVRGPGGAAPGAAAGPGAGPVVLAAAARGPVRGLAGLARAARGVWARRLERWGRPQHALLTT